MILPRPHLSYSAISTWLTAPETYRKRYYPKIPLPALSNVYTRLGNQITLDMEQNKEYVSFIPRLAVFEHPLLVDIGEVIIKGFIDSYNPKRQAFYEYKSGLRRWSKNKVDNHLQLDLYSLCLQEKYGKVQNKCSLIYIETEKIQPKPVMMNGIELKGLGVEPILKITGHHEVTHRVITQDNRDEMRELVVKIAKEISEDYKAMKHLYV